MVPMLSLVYLFYFLMISWLLSRKRVDFMYLWCLSADFKNFWWFFTSLGKPMSLVHFSIRLIVIMSTVQCFYFLSGKMLGIYVLTFGLIKFGKHKYRYDCFALKLSTINVEIEYCMRSIFYLCFIVLAYLQKLLLKVLGCCRNGCHLKRVSKSCLVILNFR